MECVFLSERIGRRERKEIGWAAWHVVGLQFSWTILTCPDDKQNPWVPGAEEWFRITKVYGKSSKINKGALVRGIKVVDKHTGTAVARTEWGLHD